MVPSSLSRSLRDPMGKMLTVGFVLGGITGEFVGPSAAALQPLGDLLIRLLTLLVLPILVCTIVSGLGAISPRGLGRIGAQSALVYGVAAVSGAALGVAAALITRPGVGFALPVAAANRATPTFDSLIPQLVPSNVVAALADGQFFGVVLFTVPFALAIASLRQSEHAESAGLVYAFFDGCGRATHVLLRGVMLYAPIGIFALAAVTFGRQNAHTLSQFANVLLTVLAAELVGGIALVAVVAACLPAGVSAFGLRDVVVTAFVTGSSAATLPVELETAERHLRLAPRIFSLTLPLGIGTSKMGSAIYIAVVSLFTANAASRAITPGLLGIIVLLSAIGSVATPPAASGALLVLGFVFSQAGLPLEAIGIIAAIPFIGKLNTPVNSLGRLATTALVARTTRL